MCKVIVQDILFSLGLRRFETIPMRIAAIVKALEPHSLQCVEMITTIQE